MTQLGRRWRAWGTRLLVLLAAAGLNIAGGVAPAAADGSPIAVTAGGLVRGMTSGAVRTFLGIPYAAPPVGALRWRAPQPAARWRGIRDATAFGPACAQVPGVFAANAGAGSTSEDCLYLNVYTPAHARPGLPVMVWIHGGGFTAGSASQYDASALAAAGAVVVTINYRLGPFGFLALPGLAAEAADGSAGNYGIQDQQAAMRWVRRNAIFFGGNPFDVTIFGESAGGLSVCDNLVSPTARGLFERAITESGPCVGRQPTLATVETRDQAIAAALGCASAATQVACLRAVPAAAVLAVTDAGGPNVDGAVIPQQIPAAIAAGQLAHVPVMEGTNHDEDRLFVAIGFDLAGRPVTAAQYPALIAAQFGAAAPQVLAQYPVTAFPTPSQALATVITDVGFSCAARTADGLLSAHVPTFAYEFADPSPPEFIVQDPVMPLGAFHASELQFLFPTAAGRTLLTPQESALSAQMVRYWTTFAANGNPNAVRAPFWFRYQPAADLFQSLAPAGTRPAGTFAADHHCAFWSALTAA